MTGVIVGVSHAVNAETANRIVALLRERFPGVNFALVDNCSAIAVFDYGETVE